MADIAGVSVRTLHYYDQIGLLKPKHVSPAGYRLYTDEDLERLQQILFFKELDFDLHDIKAILDDPGFDRYKALIAHKELLIEKKKRLERIIKTVDKTIQSIKGGIKMDEKDMFEGFDMSEIEKHKAKYADEVKKRWGNTDAYRESMEKTSKYTKEDWAKIISRQKELDTKLAALMDKGPADPEVQELISQRRQYITDYFYNCTPEIFRGLGEMYVNDERFTKKRL